MKTKEETFLLPYSVRLVLPTSWATLGYSRNSQFFCIKNSKKTLFLEPKTIKIVGIPMPSLPLQLKKWSFGGGGEIPNEKWGRGDFLDSCVFFRGYLANFWNSPLQHFSPLLILLYFQNNVWYILGLYVLASIGLCVWSQLQGLRLAFIFVKAHPEAFTIQIVDHGSVDICRAFCSQW